MKKITEKQLIESARALRDYTNVLEASQAPAQAPSQDPYYRLGQGELGAIGDIYGKSKKINPTDIGNIGSRMAQVYRGATENPSQPADVDYTPPLQAWGTPNIMDNPSLNMGASTQAPAATPAQAPAQAPTAKSGSWQEIYQLNKDVIGADPNRIKPGQQLKLPNGSTYVVKSGDSLSKIAASQKTGKTPTAQPVAATQVPKQQVQQPTWGDDADEQAIQARINQAQQFYNLPADQQAAANMSLGSTGPIASVGGQPAGTVPATNATPGPQTYGLGAEKPSQFNMQPIREHVTVSTEDSLARIIQLSRK